MIDKMPKHPPINITIQMPTLADALEDSQETKVKLKNIRTKYGRPDPKDMTMPDMQMEGDDRS